MQRARELRRAGATMTEIGQQLDVSRSTVSKWLNPERAREYQRRSEARPARKAQKRAWHREHYRGSCDECGAVTARRQTALCRRCWLEKAAAFKDSVVAGYRAGKTPIEMADELGVSPAQIAVAAMRLRRGGVALPYAPTGGAAHRGFRR